MAGIIKAGERELLGGGLPESAAFNFEDMTVRAERYLESVRQQAEAILSAAHDKAMQVARDAIQEIRQSAAAEAEERMQEELAAKLDGLVPALQQAVQSIEVAKHSWIGHWEKETVALAIAIAERIARRELQIQPEIQVELVREALQLALGEGELKLHLHPADREAILPAVQRMAGEVLEQVPTEIIADPEVSPGGCRVCTQFGTIDQTLEAQLARIEEELTS